MELKKAPLHLERRLRQLYGEVISISGFVLPYQRVISRQIKIMARMTAASPAIGQAYRTPSMPNASGMSLP